jgi:hypothetical protein
VNKTCGSCYEAGSLLAFLLLLFRGKNLPQRPTGDQGRIIHEIRKEEVKKEEKSRPRDHLSGTDSRRFGE